MCAHTRDLTHDHEARMRGWVQKLDTGLEYGLDYGLNNALNFGLDFGLDSRTYKLTSQLQAFPLSSFSSLVPRVGIFFCIDVSVQGLNNVLGGSTY